MGFLSWLHILHASVYVTQNFQYRQIYIFLYIADTTNCLLKMLVIYLLDYNQLCWGFLKKGKIKNLLLKYWKLTSFSGFFFLKWLLINSRNHLATKYRKAVMMMKSINRANPSNMLATFILNSVLFSQSSWTADLKTHQINICLMLLSHHT